jgi:excisionase family DNA binding protein
MKDRVSAKDIARKLSVSAETVRRLARAEKIPSVKVGRSVRFDPDAVELALSNKRR